MQRHRIHSARAFTLVELLVVIAIIGVLVALLLPAVQAAREAARRMKCGNHLKQIGLALHNHADSIGTLPAARHAILKTPGPGAWIHSWTPKVLPYIEQQNLFEKYRFDEDWDDANNDAATVGPIKQKIEIFLCPSAPGNLQRGQGGRRSASDYAATTERNWPNTFVSQAQAGFVSQSDPNYIGVLGHDVPVDSAGATDAANAVSIRLARRRITDIKDGTSNTFLVAECAGRNQWWFMGRRIGQVDRGPWANPNGRIQIGGCDPNDQTATIGPKPINCINDKEIYSFHPGGAMVVFADGSVRFVKQTISLDLTLALLTRERGEVVQGDF